MASYPRIGWARPNDHGGYTVKVYRSATEVEELAFPNKEDADTARRTLRRAAAVLISASAAREEIKVLGVEPHATGRWRIRYKVGKKRREEYRDTEQAARERAEELRRTEAGQEAAVEGALPNCIRTGKGIREDWQDALWWLLQQVARNPTSERWQRASKTAATLAGAARKYLGEDEEATPADRVTRMSHEELALGIIRMVGRERIAELIGTPPEPPAGPEDVEQAEEKEAA